MTLAAPGKGNTNLRDVYSVRSDRLPDFRAILHEWKQLQPVLGAAAQFRVVIDSNVVIGDLLWLCGDRKDPEAKTTLMEVIEAETVDAYVPPELIEEVEEKIPLLAAEKGLDREQMLEEWGKYKSSLKVKRPDPEKVERLRSGIDPDDGFFIALAQTIGACGVLSKDKHIQKMGGNQISIDCMVALRDYSRNIAISLNIKVSGVMLTEIGLVAIRGVFVGIRSLASSISRAPDWVKIALLAGGIFVACHPEARARVVGWLKSAMSGLKEISAPVAEHIAEASVLSADQEKEAEKHLEKALVELIHSERSSRGGEDD